MYERSVKMKKILMLLMCAAVLGVECAACDFSKSTTGEASTSTTEAPKTVTVTNDNGEIITSLAPDTDEDMEQINSTTAAAEIVTQPHLSQKEIDEAIDQYKKYIDSLDSDKIKKVKMLEYIPNSETPIRHECENELGIRRLLELLKKMEFSVVDTNPPDDIFVMIDFYGFDGKEMSLGSFNRGETYLGIAGCKCKTVIVNYKELNEEFKKLNEKYGLW